MTDYHIVGLKTCATSIELVFAEVASCAALWLTNIDAGSCQTCVSAPAETAKKVRIQKTS
jgi:hypothetical protein